MSTTNGTLADASDMFLVHTMFRREFGLMPGLVRETPPDDPGRVALVADHIAFVTATLTLHHTGEDTDLWPRLRERGAAELAAIVGVMEDQHQAIHHGLDEVDRARL